MHAKVYKCFKIEDAKRERPFAVKVSRESDEEKKMAHTKEYEITSKLNHKNVVRSIDFFDNEFTGEIHQIMEFIDGKEVLDTIAEQPQGKYTEDLAKDIFYQILEGIQYLHEQGVAHRDIKPQNLVVTKDNRVIILDFNVSSQKPSS